MCPLMSPDYLILLAPYLLFPIVNIPVFHSQTPSTLPCQEPDSMICRYTIPILFWREKTMFYSVPTTNRAASYVKVPRQEGKRKEEKKKKEERKDQRKPRAAARAFRDLFGVTITHPTHKERATARYRIRFRPFAEDSIPLSAGWLFPFRRLRQRHWRIIGNFPTQ